MFIKFVRWKGHFTVDKRVNIFLMLTNRCILLLTLLFSILRPIVYKFCI